MKKSIFKAGAAYFLVVLAGYSADLLVYSALVHAGWHVVTANVLAFALGAVLNAVLIRAFVFQGNQRFGWRTDMALTIGVNLVVFALGTTLLSWLVNHRGMNPYLSKVAVNALTFGLNFGVRAAFFRKS